MADKASAKAVSPLLPRRPGSGRRDSRRRDPTLCGAAVVVTFALLAGAIWLLPGSLRPAEPQPSCIRYAPESCLYKVNTARRIKRPPCAPEACRFDEAILDCPFAANGSFLHLPKSDAAQPCADPYMEGVRRPSLPTCGESCCSGDLPGTFRRDKSTPAPGMVTWQPKKTNGTRCSYHQYTGAEVLHHLQQSKTRLLVVGDSLQKQLHGRMVHMFRGRRVMIDNRVFTMARYALCSTGDSYVIAPTYSKRIKGYTPEPTLKALPGFFGQPAHIPACDSEKDPVAIIDSLYSAWFLYQPGQIEAYIKTLQPDEHLVMIVAIGFIDHAVEPTAEWQKFILGIRKRVKVIIMSSPTGLMESKQRVESLRHRNKALQRWAAAAGGIGFVDFDAMSRDARHPPHCVGNVHWMCWLDWGGRSAKSANQTLPNAGDNVLRDARYGTPVTSVYTTEDGQCRDEMNRNLAQILWNMILKDQ